MYVKVGFEIGVSQLKYSENSDVNASILSNDVSDTPETSAASTKKP